VKGVFRPLGSPTRGPVALVVALALGGALTGAATASAQTATTESYQALVGQISANQVRAATINRKAHLVKVTLDDGSVQHVDYPPKQEKQLSNSLRQHGANVKIAKRKRIHKAVHHRLRYIAGGIVGVFLVGGLGVLIVRGRRPPSTKPQDEPGSPPQGAPPPESPVSAGHDDAPAP
jgi:ATP-dependent Zn protease